MIWPKPKRLCSMRSPTFNCNIGVGTKSASGTRAGGVWGLERGLDTGLWTGLEVGLGDGFGAVLSTTGRDDLP